jgi:hypothetical protein
MNGIFEIKRVFSLSIDTCIVIACPRILVYRESACKFVSYRKILIDKLKHFEQNICFR